MAFSQDIHWDAEQPDDDKENTASVLMDLMMNDLEDALSGLDDIEEPSPEDLAKLDDEFELEAEAPLALLPAFKEAAFEEPELVSLEGLDDINELDELDEMDEMDELDEMDDEQLADVDDFIDQVAAGNYMDIDSEELNDEGYDLDEADDIDDYHALYGADDSIIPSFRDEDLDNDDEGAVAFYDDLR